MNPKCDASCCEKEAIFTCDCIRCASEPEDDEKFHSCNIHRVDVEEKHYRIRQRVVVWIIRKNLIS